MELNKIQSRLLIIFSVMGMLSYYLVYNNFVHDNLSLLFCCFFLILILGVSHGALDHIRGKRILEPFLNKKWPIVFFPGYILLGLVVIISWIQFPPITLFLFLIVAGYHFGEEDLSFFKVVCSSIFLKYSSPFVSNIFRIVVFTFFSIDSVEAVILGQLACCLTTQYTSIA